MARCVTDVGWDDPFVAGELRRFLAVFFLLVPDAADRLDADDGLGRWHRTQRSICRTLVGLRHGRVPDSIASPRDLVTALPLRWSAEYVARCAHHGHPGSAGLLDGLGAIVGAPLHPMLRRLRDADDEAVASGASRLLAGVAIPPSEPLELRLFGTPVVRSGGEDAPLKRVRVAQVLAWVALHGPTSRTELAASVWRDSEPSKARGSLRSTLLHARELLEPGRSGDDAGYALREHNEVLRLHRSDWFSTDVWTASDLLDSALEAVRRGDDGAAGVAARRAFSIVARGLGAEVEDIPEIAERLHALRNGVIDQMCGVGERLLARGDLAEADRVAHDILDVDSYSERALAILIATRITEGDPAGARAAIERCLEVLAELEVEPSPGTTMLIRRHERRTGDDLSSTA